MSADLMGLPIKLPDGWTAEDTGTYGVIICAMQEDGYGKGYVTVDERLRGFELGMAVVRKRGDYAGRGWKAALYSDAVALLQKTIS